MIEVALKVLDVLDGLETILKRKTEGKLNAFTIGWYRILFKDKSTNLQGKC